MNCATTRSNVPRLIKFSSLAVTVTFLMVGHACANTQIVNLGVTANAIPVPRFNQLASQGWLTDVDLRVTLSSSSTVGTVASHSHTLVGSIPISGTTSSSGQHAHSVTVPNFSGGGITIDPIPDFNTFSGGAHSHTVNAFATSTNLAGTHSHSVPSVSSNHLYSGGAISPFLGSSTFYLNGPLSQTDSAGLHNHAYSVGVNSTGTHVHSFSDLWSTQTTFTFDPNDAPIADANGDYNLTYGNVLNLSGIGSHDPDAAFGDYVVQYQWDLDNNSTPNFSTPSPTLSLTEAQYGGYFTTPGVHTIGLRVVDSLNRIGTYDLANVIIPPAPGDGNGDGWVDGLDYLLWAGAYGTHPGPDGDISDGDYNDDGWIDGLDYLLWAGNYGSHFGSTAVPEPGTWSLLVLGIVGVVLRRRRGG